MKNKIVCSQIWQQVKSSRSLLRTCNTIFIFLGLGSILFAISIDKPELNSGIIQKTCHIKNKFEPVIEPPIPGILSNVCSRPYIYFTYFII